MENEIVVLLKIDDRIIAEDIQNLLDEEQVYTILESENPASSVLNITTGFNINENIKLRVNNLDLEKAKQILLNSQYKDLI